MTDTGKLESLVERLRRKVQVAPMLGGGHIGTDGSFSSYVIDDGKRLANPDGPEAADTIAALDAERAADKVRIGELEAALEPFADVAETIDDIGRADEDDDRIWVVQAHGCKLADMVEDDFRRAAKAIQHGGVSG